MRRGDFLWLLAGFGVLLILTAPAWLDSRRALANFGDLYTYHYPMRHLVAGALEAGRLPFWNPYLFCGLPLLANSQAAVFYPVSILGTLVPLTLALTWDMLWHWAWAGMGTYLLGRRNGLSSLGAALLAAAFALSPFVVYRITEGIPTLLAALSWAPWCWLALQSGIPGLLAAAWALQFLSGHPQFLAVNAMGMFLFVMLRRPGLLLRAAGEGLGAAGLALAQWPLTLEFLGRSVRASWPASFTTAYSVPWPTLRTWLDPGALGTPLAGTWADVPSVFFETAGLYVGLPVLGLAAWGAWRARGGAPLLLTAAGLFLAAGGHNPAYRWLVEHTPLGFLRTPARYQFLCLWGLLLAVGTALRGAGRALPAWALAFAVAWTGADLAAWSARFVGAEDSRPKLAPDAGVMERAAGASQWRVLTHPEIANPNKTMLYRLANVNGYEAFYLDGYPEFASGSEGRAAADPSRTHLTRADTPQMRRAGVRYRVTPSGHWEENGGAMGLAHFVKDGSGEVRADAPLRVPRPERWRVSGRRPRDADRLILAQAFYPGWRAVLSGGPVPVERWGGIFQSVRVPRAGAYDLDLRFEPTGWPLWAAGAVLAWAAWLALMVRKTPA